MILSEEFFKLDGGDIFMVPAIRSGINADTVFADISNGAFDIPVRVRQHHTVTNLIGGVTFQGYGFLLDRFQGESVPLLLVHRTEDGGDHIPFEGQTGFRIAMNDHLQIQGSAAVFRRAAASQLHGTVLVGKGV